MNINILSSVNEVTEDGSKIFLGYFRLATKPLGATYIFTHLPLLFDSSQGLSTSIGELRWQ